MFVPARVLNNLTGQLISGKYVIGDIVHLKIRFFYKYIKQNFCWDNYKYTVDQNFILEVQPREI